MRLGIRAQLLVAMGAVLLVALLPLFVVVERLTQANLRQIWEVDARALGRSVASHVAEARQSRTDADLEALLGAEVGSVAGLGLYDRGGRLVRSVGGPALLPADVSPAREEVRRVEAPNGSGLVVVVPGKGGPVAALLVADRAALRAAPVVRLVALYIGLVGLTLLLLTHVVLTRYIIGPVKRLSEAAARFAEGDRKLEAPREGARELVELGSSLASMTDRLVKEEEELRRTIADVRAAKEQLERAQDTVVRSERLASVGRLAAGLAHEIGNPLAAISSFEELLLESPNLDPEERDFVLRMKRETERVHHVLRDLLDFARPARGLSQGAEPPGQGDVAEAVNHVVKLVRPQPTFRELRLLIEINDRLPRVRMRPERLEQVLVNLLLNAADVCPPGGTAVVRAAHAGDQVRVEVEDDGGGVDPAVAATLFEPFVTTKDVGKGTGLGLAVCRGLVEAAGGSIRHESGERGARFIVELPGIVEADDRLGPHLAS
ncbi:MAG: HAMP domain-containing histidine kinase [Deltaproteobacteria bacterium]|nr:HAMP domain-containing histidine kinase [Deltaproteobacteria bacterium]